MSDQTARVRPFQGFGWRIVISAVITIALVWFGLGRSGFQAVGRYAAQGHLHAPRLDLIAQMPLAIQIHLLTVLGAFLVATVIMLGAKGTTLHRTLGWGFAILMTTTAVVALFIHGPNGFQFSPLHLFSVFVLLILPVGVLAARGHNVARHSRTMTGLYFGSFFIAGVIAFLPGRLMWQIFFG